LQLDNGCDQQHGGSNHNQPNGGQDDVAEPFDEPAPPSELGLCYVNKVAKDWCSVDDRSRQFLSRQTQTNYLQSAMRLSLNPLSELLGRSRASGDDDVPDTPALLLQTVKEFPS
jgi:hypothetical protein